MSSWLLHWGFHDLKKFRCENAGSLLVVDKICQDPNYVFDSIQRSSLFTKSSLGNLSSTVTSLDLTDDDVLG